MALTVSPLAIILTPSLDPLKKQIIEDATKKKHARSRGLHPCFSYNIQRFSAENLKVSGKFINYAEKLAVKTRQRF